MVATGFEPAKHYAVALKTTSFDQSETPPIYRYRQTFISF